LAEGGHETEGEWKKVSIAEFAEFMEERGKDVKLY